MTTLLAERIIRDPETLSSSAVTREPQSNCSGPRKPSLSRSAKDRHQARCRASRLAVSAASPSRSAA